MVNGHQNWSDSFDDKLHGMTGYATEMAQNTDAGARFAKYLKGEMTGSPCTIEFAWRQTSIDLQYSYVEGAIYSGYYYDSHEGTYLRCLNDYLPGHGISLEPNYSDTSVWGKEYYYWEC